MNFYTNITQWGNYLLLREVVNGERLVRKVKYSPTLYAPVAKQTEHKTLCGKYVTESFMFSLFCNRSIQT